MSLFSFKNNNALPEMSGKLIQEDHSEAPQMHVDSDAQKPVIQEIPEHIFIESANPKPSKVNEVISANPVNDLHALYRHLEQNFEKKGYEDALINPDTSYMEENITVINNNLKLLISKINTYYSGYLRTIDFHIETRKRSGLLETVDELISHKQTVLEEINNVAIIETDSNNGVGLSQNLALSYRKGFRNGFAAITYNTVLGRK